MLTARTQILLDGVRLNNSTYRTGPVQYLYLIEPTLVDRIEVLRGPGSVLYGSDAMGGVIQVMPLGFREAGARTRSPSAATTSGLPWSGSSTGSGRARSGA